MLFKVAHEQATNEEARKYEEDVDTDEAAGHAGDTEVESDHGQDGDRAQTLQIAASAGGQATFSQVLDRG